MRQAPEPPAPIAGFAELTLETRRPEHLSSFYREVFGLRPLPHEEERSDRIWLAAGERARLGLWRPGEQEFGDEGGAHVHFAFAAGARCVDDVGRRARRHGARVEGPVEHDGGDRSVYVEDPEGNVVEVWERGRDGP